MQMYTPQQVPTPWGAQKDPCLVKGLGKVQFVWESTLHSRLHKLATENTPFLLEFYTFVLAENSTQRAPQVSDQE